jgi:hypothetical protein
VPTNSVRAIIITPQVDVSEGSILMGRGEARPVIVCENDFARPLIAILREKGILPTEEPPGDDKTAK